MSWRYTRMSLQIHNLSFFEIGQNESSELVLSKYPVIPSAQSLIEYEELVGVINRTINNKPVKGFAQFNGDSRFKASLDSLLTNDCSFTDFSASEAESLLQEMSKYPFSDEGMLIFTHYSYLACEKLVITLIPFSKGINLKADCKLDYLQYLDIPNITIAGIIDVNQYRENKQNRYVSFIKGRAGRGVNDFFIDFLQIDITVNPKQQNAILMQALDDYLEDANLNTSEVNEVKRAVYDYTKGQIKDQNEVSISELSSVINVPNACDFAEFVDSQGYELADSFPCDSRTAKKLVKYCGAGGGLKIEFDSQLLGERIFYTADIDQLVIKGLPPNIRYALSKASE